MRGPSPGVRYPGEAKLPTPEVCGNIGPVKWWEGRQLMIKTKVRTYCGVEKTVTALVDTGAQVNLIRRQIFDDDKFSPAKNAVDLRTIAGEKMGGGDKTLSLKVAFEVEDCQYVTVW